MTYDSKFERQLHTGILAQFKLHPYTEEFIRKTVYTPDLTLIVKDYEYILELKGYIYTSEGCKKIKDYREHINKSKTLTRELILVFQDPNKVFKWKQKRKDGTKMSLCQWADKNKFRWFTYDSIFMLLYEINTRRRTT